MPEQLAGKHVAALVAKGLNPDRLRTNPKAVQFVKQFFDDGKPIAVICHGPWTLIEADVVRGILVDASTSISVNGIDI